MTYYKTTNKYFEWIEEHKFIERARRYDLQVMLISKTGGIYEAIIHISDDYVNDLIDKGHELDDILHSLVTFSIKERLFNRFMEHKGYDKSEKIYQDIHDEIMNTNYAMQCNIRVPHPCTVIVVSYNFHEDWNYVSL